jgi:hypothetical protein
MKKGRLGRATLTAEVQRVSGEDGASWCEMVEKRSGVDCDNIAVWNQDLLDCESKDWIGSETVKASIIGTYTTIKCYASTLVRDEGLHDFMKSPSTPGSLIEC